MRLLQRIQSHQYRLTQKLRKDKIGRYPYAILSHTWDPDGDEVVYKDLANGIDLANVQDPRKQKWEKIKFCGEQSEKDDLQYFWIDSCCIDKNGTTEMSEAINSMFEWYERAVKCYVYLWDVQCSKEDVRNPQREWLAAFKGSRWFTRRWTLQELLSPRSVEFFSREGTRLGTKESLKLEIHAITGISTHALQGTPLRTFSVEERLRWAARRNATYEEDEAYSLAGLFRVWINPRYGEGRGSAHSRLRDKIRKCQYDRTPQNSHEWASDTSPVTSSAVVGSRMNDSNSLYSAGSHSDFGITADSSSVTGQTTLSVRPRAEGLLTLYTNHSEVDAGNVQDEASMRPGVQLPHSFLQGQDRLASPVDLDLPSGDAPFEPLPTSTNATDSEVMSLSDPTMTSRMIVLDAIDGGKCTYFLDGEGLSNHVVMSEVGYMAGPDAQVRGVKYKQRHGYFVVGRLLDNSQVSELERQSGEHDRNRRMDRQMMERV